MVPADSPRSIRPARADELAGLRELELLADERYGDVGFGPFAQSDEENHLDRAAVVLVSGDPPVGFACVEVVDGNALLWQLSVHPDAGRRGLGSALVEAVCDWARERGHGAVVLTTYRDVLWNAPFYARLGFEVVPEADLTPGLAAIRRHEQEIGDDDYGPRVAMRRLVETGGPEPPEG